MNAYMSGVSLAAWLPLFLFSQGCVKVAVRCRPPFQDELTADAAGKIVVSIEQGRGADRIVLNSTSSQVDMHALLTWRESETQLEASYATRIFLEHVPVE